jgi:hypothetical protein
MVPARQDNNDEMPTKEPYWRTVLNYGSVAYFLGLPALAIFLGFTHIGFAEGTGTAKFLADFHFAVSAIVGALAGLNSFDRHKANGNQGNPPNSGNTHK